VGSAPGGVERCRSDWSIEYAAKGHPTVRPTALRTPTTRTVLGI
jgi:hypothetical protein